MNLGDDQMAKGVAAVLQSDDDDAVDPHLERIRNEAGDDESDEEVIMSFKSKMKCPLFRNSLQFDILFFCQ